MAYDDGYYYGQCKIVAVVDNTADNGKTVLITTDDNKTYSGTIANKKCEFLLPPRTLYTVQKVSSGSTEFTTKVEAGYGDCILVHLDTGYVEVKQGDIVGLDYIKAATDANLKNKVPEAKAVKELNNSLVANSKHFYFDYKNGKYGYNTNPNRGADTFHPFSNSQVMTISPFTSLSKTIELDIEPSYVVIFTTTETGYPTIYSNGKIQTTNNTVCKIDSVNGNKVTFSHASNNLSWTYVLMAIA